MHSRCSKGVATAVSKHAGFHLQAQTQAHAVHAGDTQGKCFHSQHRLCHRVSNTHTRNRTVPVGLRGAVSSHSGRLLLRNECPCGVVIDKDRFIHPQLWIERNVWRETLTRCSSFCQIYCGSHLQEPVFGFWFVFSLLFESSWSISLILTHFKKVFREFYTPPYPPLSPTPLQYFTTITSSIIDYESSRTSLLGFQL